MSQRKHNWFARHKVLTGVGAVALVVAVGGAVGAGGGSDDKSPTAAATKETPEKTEKAGGTGETPKDGKKKEKGLGDGSFQVGSDIRPGTYVSTGNKDGCYWERAKDASGSTDAILANDNVTGASYVTVLASDKIFKSSDCQDWHLVDPKAAKGAPKATLKGNGGMFKVGADIAPGTYKSTGNKDDQCYWERAKDASHSTEAIAANENVTGTAIVKVGAGDAYFKSSGCQDWVKTG
ncbi:hypothetical protein A8W25_11800 [Streptomyces sp. ERV7]|uniref:hypothetical protein n=1 Tax=Streptomyces sp. ERV7 TaxID=1322334 RepID=UPI0007F53B26|nr:hypothetical protein [Streptomyces sp. ERV7]OAR26136.1 hypothetical protein A8W25_11800 [Streptomyces sp. ERV7]